MTRVTLFDQNDTHFATFEMPELPREGDVLEFALPGEAHAKSFYVRQVTHKMVFLPDYEEVVKNLHSAPWEWELQLHGELADPYDPDAECICAQGVTKCPRHGDQPAEREMCPLCGRHVLGYCAQGEYCTNDDCGYVA